MKNILIVSNTTYGIEMFLLEALEQLARRHNVVIVTNTRDLNYFDSINCKTISVKLVRKPNVFRDVINTLHLVKIIKRNNTDLILSFTPKSGLISSLAGFITRVRSSHTFTGQVWSTKSGLVKWFLMMLDWVILSMNYRSYCDSYSQADFIANSFPFRIPRIHVVANGSLGGVDLTKYYPIESDSSNDSISLLYLARKTRDKGAFDVLRAFAIAVKENPSLKLYYIGPEEEVIPSDCIDILNTYGRQIVNINGIVDAKEYLSLSQILLLPSRREGFGSIVIQAAAMGIPTVGYNIYGLTCSVGAKSGILVPVGDIEKLSSGIDKMVSRINVNPQKVKDDCRSWSERFNSVQYALEWNNEIESLLD